MTKKRQSKLTEEQKELIETSWLNGNSQAELAELFDVSPRTIGRVLKEAGRLAPEGMADEIKRKGKNVLTADEQKCLELLREKEIDSDRLQRILKTPVLNSANMVKAVAGFNDQTTLNFLTAVKNRRKLDAIKQSH